MTIEEDLVTEAIARFAGNSRGTPIAKKAFIEGAIWMLDKHLASLRSELAEKDKEIEAQIRAGERLRMMDAASAINEANELRQKIKDQDLIIHGITEGSAEWETLANDRLRDANHYKSLCEAADKVIQSVSAHSYVDIELFEKYDQLKNTKP